jgi:hypothetical protein
LDNIPPARQGGEAKDCTILEECLAVSRRLHELVGDFAGVGLRFTANLPWGVHDVTH